jgi:hypothetical protein
MDLCSPLRSGLGEGSQLEPKEMSEKSLISMRL